MILCRKIDGFQKKLKKTKKKSIFFKKIQKTYFFNVTYEPPH